MLRIFALFVWLTRLPVSQHAVHRNSVETGDSGVWPITHWYCVVVTSHQYVNRLVTVAFVTVSRAKNVLAFALPE